MPLQEISVNRSRGWSLDTASTVEEHPIYSGSGRRLLEPQRQPLNAPVSPPGHGQANEGFVRFLKTHSSPTHQRVTAGGRIVPMERPSAPPHFKLSVVDNLNHARTVPSTRRVGDDSLRREQRLENSSSAMHSERRNGARKPFDPNANFQLGHYQRVLTEPFQKFHGQTGEENIQKATAVYDKSYLDRNTGIERNVGRPDLHSCGTGQNTVHSKIEAPERPLPTDTASRAAVIASRQAHLPIHGTAWTAQAGSSPQNPRRVQASQQQTFETSQYVPNATSFALDGVSAALSPDLGHNAQGANQYPPDAGLGTYQGLDVGANQTVLYPSLSPMMPQGFQVSPFGSLPVYPSQLGLIQPAYYPSDPFNTSAPLMPVLPMQPFAGTPTSFAAPGALSAGGSKASTQVELHQEVASAKAAFDESTEQERILDQYLAMNMDKMELQTRRALTGKRMQIVEERAAAKDRINQANRALSTQIARTTNIQSDTQSFNSIWSAAQNHSANRLNVQAPSWIPKTGADGNKAVTIQHPTPLISTASDITSQKVSPSHTNIDGPKSTPLKPTRVASEDSFTAKQTTVNCNPEEWPVDEWGARLGAAPPELERQQSELNELLESMASEASRPSHSPQKSIGDVSDPAGSWEARDGQAPREIKADHEQYLDAMRRRLGTISDLTLSSGHMVKVEGQNYKQLKPEHVSTDLEKDYWMRKPDLDQRLGAWRPRPFERPFENAMRTPPQKSRQTEDWVNGIVDVQKPMYTGRAPWMADGMNLLSTKGEPSISLQDEHAMSKSRGANGAAGHLRGQR